MWIIQINGGGMNVDIHDASMRFLACKHGPSSTMKMVMLGNAEYLGGYGRSIDIETNSSSMMHHCLPYESRLKCPLFSLPGVYHVCHLRLALLKTPGFH
jgi:hypothetical protein